MASTDRRGDSTQNDSVGEDFGPRHLIWSAAFFTICWGVVGMFVDPADDHVELREMAWQEAVATAVGAAIAAGVLWVNADDGPYAHVRAVRMGVRYAAVALGAAAVVIALYALSWVFRLS